MKKKIEELDKTIAELEKIRLIKKELEAQNVDLLEQKNDIYLQLQAEQDNLSDAQERIERMINEKVDFEQQIKDMEERLLDEEDAAAALENLKKKMEGEIDDLKKDVEDLETSLAKVAIDFYTTNL